VIDDDPQTSTCVSACGRFRKDSPSAAHPKPRNALDGYWDLPDSERRPQLNHTRSLRSSTVRLQRIPPTHFPATDSPPKKGTPDGLTAHYPARNDSSKRPGNLSARGRGQSPHPSRGGTLKTYRKPAARRQLHTGDEINWNSEVWNRSRSTRRSLKWG